MEWEQWRDLRLMSMLNVTVSMILILVGCGGTLAELYRVGDTKGWNQNVNYTQWSSERHFYVGDWIIFYFDKHMYNVLEVNKTSYEQCNERDFIHNITKGGRDVYQLSEARPYYFLSGGGFCWNGMKLSLDVQQNPPPTVPPAPSQHKNASSPSHKWTVFNFIFLIALLSITLMMLY